MEDGVNDAFSEGDGGARTVLNGLDELVAIHLALLKEREDEELGHAIHEVRVGLTQCH